MFRKLNDILELMIIFLNIFILMSNLEYVEYIWLKSIMAVIIKESKHI